MTDPFQQSDLALTLAGPEHAGDIAEIHGERFTPGWTADSVLQLIQQPTSLSLVANAASPANVVGFLLGRLVADEAETLSIAVAPAWQRRGIGRRLLASWGALATGRGATRLFLEVATDNAPAIAMYAARGFREINRRRAYYRHPDGSTCDALALAKAISTDDRRDGRHKPPCL